MKDYGFDPVGDGRYKMVPSGDIVDKEERDKRCPPISMTGRKPALIGSLNAFQVQMMQGGKLRE